MKKNMQDFGLHTTIKGNYFMRFFKQCLLITFSYISLFSYAGSQENNKSISIGTYELKLFLSEDIPQKYYLGSEIFKATNQDLAIKIPPVFGKYWLVSKSTRKDFRLMKLDTGNNGKCEKINWMNSDKDGIEVVASLGEAGYHQYQKKPANSPAFVRCAIKGPVNSIEDDIRIVTNKIKDILPHYTYPMTLPNNLKSFELNIWIANKNYVITSIQKNDLFDVTIEGDRLFLIIH